MGHSVAETHNSIALPYVPSSDCLTSLQAWVMFPPEVWRFESKYLRLRQTTGVSGVPPQPNSPPDMSSTWMAPKRLNLEAGTGSRQVME
jgi:hypothetical protein